MGLNVIVQRLDLPWNIAGHPDWDDVRYSVDRSLWDIMKIVPIEQREAAGFPYMDDSWWWRPADFAAFRAALPADTENDRLRHLADLLEADPRYWIRMSI